MKSGQCDEIPTEAPPLSDHRGERRATLRALEIWSNAREHDDIPFLANLNGGANMAEQRKGFTENQFLILFEPYPSNSVVIFYGAELPDLPILRVVGKNLHETLPAVLRDIFHDACLEAADSGDAVYRHGMIRPPSGAHALYRSIFMPVRSESHADRIYIFGAFSIKEDGAKLLAAA